MSEPLPVELAAALERGARRRGRFGQPVVFLSTTGSTNDVAAAMAERGAPEGALVVAAAQTAGRGRLGREWFSPPGAGLYASLVCRDPRAVPLLTLAGGVAVADGIRSATGLPVALKWPNDVITAGPAAGKRWRKLAGVLAEGSSGAGGLHHVVLGFGVNLQPAAYPAALGDRATAIETELGRAVDGPTVLVEILCAFNEQFCALVSGDAASVLARWRRLAPAADGARVEWTAGGVVHRGTAAGIDEDGALLVRAGSRVERIVAGEILWL